MMQEFVQQVEETVREATYDIHTALPGTIAAFDASTGMATVKPEGTVSMKNGKKLKYPSIVKVPVVFPQGKDVSIAFPVKAGDGCMIIICENDLKPWMSHGKETASDMKFDLTNAVCIPGLHNEGNEALKKAVEENAIVLKNEEMEIVVKKDEVSIKYGKSCFSLNENSLHMAYGQCNMSINNSGVEINGNLSVSGNIEGGSADEGHTA